MTVFCQAKKRQLVYIVRMDKVGIIQKNLREAIKHSGMMQKEIAKKLGVDPTTISKYMIRNTFPSLDTFARLCEIIDVSSDDILGLNR